MLLQLVQYLMDVVNVRESNEDLDFHGFDIYWIVEIAEEELDFFFNHDWLLLKNQIDVFQSYIHNLWFHV